MNTPLKPAVFIRNLDGWRGDARLIKLSEAVDCHDHHHRGKTTTTYVIVSAVHSAIDTKKPETMIFPAESDGEPMNHVDMVAIDDDSHDDALAALGFIITD